MSNFQIRTFARMARASGFTREDAAQRLAAYKGPELQQALDAAYLEDPETVKNEFLATYNAIKPILRAGEGVDVDQYGRDEADRASIAAMIVMNEKK